MTFAIRRYAPQFAAIIALMAIAIVSGIYILHHERLRIPFLDQGTFELKAELADAKSVTPGQGQTIRVAGVRVGDISAVTLKDGRALVSFSVLDRYRHLIHTDATALLRPQTGLDDMFVEVYPGSQRAPLARPGWTIPVSHTLPYVSLDQIESQLDADTRGYLRLLLNGAGHGLAGAGGQLRDILRRFEPTDRDLATFATAVATRRTNLARLINSLHLLNRQLAGNGPQITHLVDAAAVTFHALASENQNISRAVSDLPATLAQTTQTLDQVRTYANVLGPAANDLRPTFRAINTANFAVRPFVREAAPILHSQIRPFVRQLRPLVRNLRPAAVNLARATPNLTGSFGVLNDLFNMIAFNPGPESPSAPNRYSSFLFWIAWVTHQSENLFSSQDAHGNFRPITFGGTCQTFNNLAAQNPGAEYALNLTPLLTSAAGCNEPTSALPALPTVPGVPTPPGLPVAPRVTGSAKKTAGRSG